MTVAMPCPSNRNGRRRQLYPRSWTFTASASDQVFRSLLSITFINCRKNQTRLSHCKFLGTRASRCGHASCSAKNIAQNQRHAQTPESTLQHAACWQGFARFKGKSVDIRGQGYTWAFHRNRSIFMPRGHCCGHLRLQLWAHGLQELLMSDLKQHTGRNSGYFTSRLGHMELCG